MARIRTVKPEFWRHEGLSALPESTHLLAAALLNYADDDGYFNANPKLVQAECFPLREPSVSIHDSLTALARQGYLRIGTGPDGRRYGHIVNFHQHQHINRKTDSKIKPLEIVWEPSCTTHGALMESSRLEGKGREQGKGMEQGGAYAAPAAPPRQTELLKADPDPNPAAFLFGTGLRWLMKNSGRPEAQCRSLIGKWRKTRGDPEVAGALVAAQQENVSQAVEWIEKRLQSNGQRKPSDLDNRRALADAFDEVAAEAEARARGMGT
jgi:hypothetical protein